MRRKLHLFPLLLQLSRGIQCTQIWRVLRHQNFCLLCRISYISQHNISSTELVNFSKVSHFTIQSSGLRAKLFWLSYWICHPYSLCDTGQITRQVYLKTHSCRKKQLLWRLYTLNKHCKVMTNESQQS
jgi:hypothetical protein